MLIYLSFEAFLGTEFNEIFSGKQPRQDVKFFRRFGYQLRPHLQSVLVVWQHQNWRLGVLVLQNHQHTLKIGTELYPETSENLHVLTRLSAR